MGAQSETSTTGETTAKPSETIIDLIADLEGVDPIDLSPPLYSVIDPEALDALFDTRTGDGPMRGHVYFQYCGYEIRVQDDGEVAILNR